MSSEPELAPEQPAHRLRSWALTGLKVTVTVALLAWLIASGVLDFGSLRLLTSTPQVLALTLGTWVVVSILFSSTRWRVLLGVMGVHISARRAASLQLMALFFNGVVPGNVGGDVLKNIYVADRQTLPKSKLVLLVLVERAVGLSGLVAAASLLAGLNAPALLADAHTWPLLLVLGALDLGLLLLPWLLSYGLGTEKLRTLLGNRTSAAGLVGRAFRILELLQAERPRLLRAFWLSVGLHSVCMLYFCFLSGIYGGPGLSVGQAALTFPLGILSVVLPVSLAGLGVGHVAFEQLFKLLGASNGANVFNLYMIGQLAPSVLGAIPYLLHKREKAR